jgi:hypothetical protein
MSTLKSMMYPFGMAILAIIVANLLGIAIFGPDARFWFNWQYRALNAVGSVAAIGGFIFGVYLAVKSHARLIP